MVKRGGRPTIIDIAKLADVSFKTVSRVLNGNAHVGDKLRERVLKAAQDLNYRPNLAARSLAGPRNYSLALLTAVNFVDMQSLDDWYIPSFLSDLHFAAMLACQNAGYRLTVEICDVSNPDHVSLPAGLTESGVDGVIVSPPLSDRIELIDALEASGISYVLIAPGLHPGRGMSVATDEYGGAAAMTDHLLSLGHRRIAFVTGPAHHHAAAARKKAYLDVLAAFDGGLEPLVESGRFNFNSGYRAAETLMSMERPPTAIFCANDDMASGAVAAAAQRGMKVPDDISIAGFDDSAVARITAPHLTTVRQSFVAMATAAVGLLASTDTEKADPDRHIVLPFKIIERASTSALRN